MKMLAIARFSCALALVLNSTFSWAESIDITAVFTPDPRNPGNTEFINTTPSTGHCLNIACAAGRHSLAPKIKTLPADIKANAADLRQSALFKMPTEIKNVTIVSADGQTQQLGFQIVGAGARLQFNKSVGVISGGGHADIWVGGSWLYAGAGGCSGTGYSRLSTTFYSFFWGVGPPANCGRISRFDLEDFRYENFTFIYQLITPNPLSMKSGVYRGQLDLSVGPGGDLDFGDVMLPDDDRLTLNFILEVSHVLQVAFPAGSQHLALVPQGGWQQWLERGRRPDKLSAVQNFSLWSSMPFKMLLQCQYSVGNQCALENEVGHQVAVDTRVTLPPGFSTYMAGGPVKDLPLSSSTPTVIDVTQYMDNARGSLDFAIDRDGVEKMIVHAGSRYKGDVTVIWDGDIP